jgi:DNA-binding MarR family transcriptional regulator
MDVERNALLEHRIGYAIKRVHAALRAAMDDALRPHGLTVPQYACLELLAETPELSNAGLARGAFVTRQSMNVVLGNLEDSGLVERPAQARHGRALPARLTADGHRRLTAARTDILAIERTMTSSLPAARTRALLADLHTIAEALDDLAS